MGSIAFGFKVATDLVIMKLFPCSLLAGFLTILLANISGSTPTVPARTQDEGLPWMVPGWYLPEARRLGNTRQLDFEGPRWDYNEADQLKEVPSWDYDSDSDEGSPEARWPGNTGQLGFEVPSWDYSEARRLGNTRQLGFGLGRIIRHGMGPL